jgi:hypothetical protein
VISTLGAGVTSCKITAGDRACDVTPDGPRTPFSPIGISPIGVIDTIPVIMHKVTCRTRSGCWADFQIAEFAANQRVPKAFPFCCGAAHPDFWLTRIAKPDKSIRASDLQAGIGVAL